MLTMNRQMSTVYSQISLADYKLDRTLLEIAESGLGRKEDCFFIEKCINIDTNASLDDFPDKTGYECFINSINIDDYVDCDYLLQGVMFTRKIFSLWNDLGENQKLIANFSLDEFGLKVKFHLERSGEQWLSDELEDYEESILVVDSLDAQFN